MEATSCEFKSRHRHQFYQQKLVWVEMQDALLDGLLKSTNFVKDLQKVFIAFNKSEKKFKNPDIFLRKWI